MDQPDAGAALRMALGTPFFYPSGTRVVYSDIGLILLGLALERTLRWRLDEIVRESVTIPLGLAHTRFLPLSGQPYDTTNVAPTELCAWRKRRVVGEVDDENAARLGGIAGHAGLFSTVNDLARFGQSFLNHWQPFAGAGHIGRDDPPSGGRGRDPARFGVCTVVSRCGSQRQSLLARRLWPYRLYRDFLVDGPAAEAGGGGSDQPGLLWPGCPKDHELQGETAPGDCRRGGSMRVIGLMSGTSADGIDAALVRLEGQPPALQWKLEKHIHLEHAHELKEAIFAGFRPETGTVDRLCALNFALGEAFGRAALSVITAAGLKPQDVDLIGCHGQTLWHIPSGLEAST